MEKTRFLEWIKIFPIYKTKKDGKRFPSFFVYPYASYCLINLATLLEFSIFTI